MDSELDSWLVNPSDLTKNDKLNNVTNDGPVFDLNYDDIDYLLTQDLRDLDIPMIPSPLMNENNSSARNVNGLASHSSKQSVSHKRGLSGTAIFGFMNHNKTLSISSIQKVANELSLDGRNISKSNSNNDDVNLSHVILKQQEELRAALERQKEVNRKLEQQLRENQLQQEKLQRVLEEQEQKITVNSTSPQMFCTPSSKKTQTAEDVLIVTSNSANGRYQFPPPSMISPPMSHTSMNGSPSRRHNRSRNTPLNFQLDEEAETQPFFQEKNNLAPNAFGQITKDRNDTNFIGALNSPATFFTPEEPNPFNDGRVRSSSPFHSKKYSQHSTVSTIPQQDTDSESPNVMGLGLQIGNSKSIRMTDTLRPPPLDILPTIPGSNQTTPLKSKMPQKYYFQHTPVKAGSGVVTPQKLDYSASENHLEPPVEPEVHSSPMRARRKPTTLPPGSIDKYIKELPDKLFECLYKDCHKLFKRRYNIRSHIQTHLEDRPYICDYENCNKAFVRNHDLVRHKKSHAAKTHECACGKRFAQEEALNLHKSRMICIGGKKSDSMVRKSPNKRELLSRSPVKESIERDKDGIIASRMEQEFLKYNNDSLLKPPMDLLASNSVIFSPSPPSALSDYGTP
ncbi:hypothetical protein KAFR_0H02240 [Kazachstania africana CBS 2517]|uniref:C2H2-type domain-containing protein n=1 Tax=Kazachstania africana (strain ATCC 22294 / BCRC 22015 / CBS 2517 / CECT 1963 / NBRC 1671 / NRRL Y-8276) TaxID=1071382 RepID=H2AZ77_KAZAF|nr:hypothetical protein KAFR_0H02240 [Kazachstania africana CBS 2517]CCF59633.1 hypothetical protein KAFR_0H02240 [Kazachstania africana CBS 2517]